MSARPSGRSKMKIKVYEEDVRMATVVVWNKGCKMLISQLHLDPTKCTTFTI
jgi:hypothetical protein